MVNSRILTSLHASPLLLGWYRRRHMYEFQSKVVQRRGSQHCNRLHTFEHTYALPQKSQSTLSSKGRLDSRLCTRRIVSKTTTPSAGMKMIC